MSTATCQSEESCSKSVFARGLCSTHYFRLRRKTAPPCTHEGCQTPSYARGLCSRHYTAKDAVRVRMLERAQQPKLTEKTITIRLPDETHALLKVWSHAEGIRPNKLARQLLIEGMRARKTS